jgi:hypothetical protein
MARHGEATAATDEEVAYVLDMVASDAVRWGALYRIVEAVRHCAGDQWESIVGEELADKQALFNHTANVPGAGRFDKRHAHRLQPPSSPMWLIDGELYVRQVVAAFLSWKTDNSKMPDGGRDLIGGPRPRQREDVAGDNSGDN